MLALLTMQAAGAQTDSVAIRHLTVDHLPSLQPLEIDMSKILPNPQSHAISFNLANPTFSPVFHTDWHELFTTSLMNQTVDIYTRRSLLQHTLPLGMGFRDIRSQTIFQFKTGNNKMFSFNVGVNMDAFRIHNDIKRMKQREEHMKHYRQQLEQQQQRQQRR